MARTNRLLWVIQVALALVFAMAGGVKLVTPVEQMQDPIALPGWLLRFIGAAEVAGALGLILPGLTGIQVSLTSFAAAGLALVTLGATAITAWGGLGATALFPLAVSLLSAWVAVARRRSTT